MGTIFNKKKLNRMDTEQCNFEVIAKGSYAITNPDEDETEADVYFGSVPSDLGKKYKKLMVLTTFKGGTPWGEETSTQEFYFGIGNSADVNIDVEGNQYFGGYFVCALEVDYTDSVTYEKYSFVHMIERVRRVSVGEFDRIKGLITNNDINGLLIQICTAYQPVYGDTSDRAISFTGYIRADNLSLEKNEYNLYVAQPTEVDYFIIGLK